MWYGQGWTVSVIRAGMNCKCDMGRDELYGLCVAGHSGGLTCSYVFWTWTPFFPCLQRTAPFLFAWTIRVGWNIVFFFSWVGVYCRCEFHVQGRKHDSQIVFVKHKKLHLNIYSRWLDKHKRKIFLLTFFSFRSKKEAKRKNWVLSRLLLKQ